MSTVNVKVIEVGGDFITKQKEFITILATTEIEKLAKETAVVMKQKITDGIKRPGSTGHLADGINAEQINKFSWGVGNINILNAQVPYWRHINFGSLAIGANWQHRVPRGGFNPGSSAPNGGSFRAGRWQVGNDHFSFVPKNPIPAQNYIDRTLSEIPNIISKVVGK